MHQLALPVLHRPATLPCAPATKTTPATRHQAHLCQAYCCTTVITTCFLRVASAGAADVPQRGSKRNYESATPYVSAPMCACGAGTCLINKDREGRTFFTCPDEVGSASVRGPTPAQHGTAHPAAPVPAWHSLHNTSCPPGMQMAADGQRVPHAARAASDLSTK